MRPRSYLLALPTLALIGGCATILGGGSSQSFSLDATPSQAMYAIRSSSGIQMAEGSVPASVSLPRRNEYQIEVSLDGYETRMLAVTRGTNGWIWVNLLTGLVGFLVDFATGSAYKLEPSVVNVTLQQAQSMLGGDQAVFAVVRLLDSAGAVVKEERLKMLPIR